MLKAHGPGRALVSINKALVTQASSAIPVVPLYIAVLYKIMKAQGTHEGCIDQIQRLFSTQLYNGPALAQDDGGRVRLDDREMQPEVQRQIRDIWPRVATENLDELTDIQGYRAEFLKLFGFGLAGVDYDADVDLNMTS
jgi:enoyl-[acyl-carrier protein] reductase/trans-2-enoyl-CoA reductase (NAD+)